jgi:hypothetical protein
VTTPIAPGERARRGRKRGEPSLDQPLPSAYDGLAGDEFLDAIVERGDVTLLEAMWQLREPELAEWLVARLAAAKVERLSTLLLDELFDVDDDLGVVDAIAAVIARSAAPMLTPADAARLVSRLRDEEPFSETALENARGALERWAFSIPATMAREFTKDAALGTTPASSEATVRWDAAMALAGDDKRVGALIDDVVASVTEDKPTWWFVRNVLSFFSRTKTLAGQWNRLADTVIGAAADSEGSQTVFSRKGRTATRRPYCCADEGHELCRRPLVRRWASCSSTDRPRAEPEDSSEAVRRRVFCARRRIQPCAAGGRSRMERRRVASSLADPR